MKVAGIDCADLDRLAGLMLDVYRGHPDHYARYGKKGIEFPSNFVKDKKRSERPRAPMTRQVVLRHLRGEDSAGIYHLDSDHKVWLGEFDVDDHKGENPGWRDDAKQLYGLMKDAFGVQPIVSTGKSGIGVHITLPFADRVEAWKLRRVVAKLVKTRLPENLHGVEFFPKQDGIGADGYGNLTRLPLWGKSQFVDPENNFEPIDPLEALEDVDKATAQTVDDLFNELFQGDGVPTAPRERKSADAFDGATAPAEALMERCGFARHVKDDAAKLPYDYWYLGVGLFARTDGGSTLVHQLSEPYPGYSFEETQGKIAEVLKADGPPSCESIAGVTGGKFCDTCPARLAAEENGSTFANPLVLARQRLVKDGEVERPKTPADLIAEAEEVLADLAKLNAEEVHGPAIIGALATLHTLNKAKFGQFLTRLTRGTKGTVRDAVVAKAKERAVERRNTVVVRSDGQADLPIVPLPGGSSRVIEAAAKFGDLLSKSRSMFVRGGAPMRVGRDDEGATVLAHVKAASLPASLESVARLVQIQDTGGGPQQVSATCSKGTAEIILASQQFIEALPQIVALPQCAVLMERNGQLIAISDYDEESGILAAGGPIPEIPLDVAKMLLDELVADFHFATPADRSRAMAAIITPSLIHGDLLGGRAPVDLGEADDSQTGKGFRNQLTAAIYGDRVGTITQRKSGVGGLEESFNQALVAGKVFISLDNVRGKVDSPAIESFLTEVKYYARTPYHPNVEIDTKRVYVQLTSNKAEITRDFANRSSCTRILKQKPGYQFVRYPEGDILQHVQTHQVLFLGAVFAVVRAWHQAGKPKTEETQHDFRPWAQTLDWIVQNILGEAPLMDGHRETQARMTNPAMGWLREVALAIQRAGRFDEWLRTHNIVDEIHKVPEIKIPGLKDDGDLNDEPTRDRVLQATGRYLSKSFDGSETIEIDNLKIEKRESPDDEWRTKQEYRFTEGLAANGKCVFPDNPLTPYSIPKDVCEEKIEREGEGDILFL